MTSFALIKKLMNLKGYTYPNVLSSIVDNCNDMEATKCTSTDEWLKNKHVNIYTVKYDAAVKKKNKILQFATT